MVDYVREGKRWFSKTDFNIELGDLVRRSTMSRE